MAAARHDANAAATTAAASPTVPTP
jgi:hypothetical protein